MEWITEPSAFDLRFAAMTSQEKLRPENASNKGKIRPKSAH